MKRAPRWWDAQRCPPTELQGGPVAYVARWTRPEQEEARRLFALRCGRASRPARRGARRRLAAPARAPDRRAARRAGLGRRGVDEPGRGSSTTRSRRRAGRSRSPTRRRSRAWRRLPARRTGSTRSCWRRCRGAIWCRRSGFPIPTLFGGGGRGFWGGLGVPEPGRWKVTASVWLIDELERQIAAINRRL